MLNTLIEIIEEAGDIALDFFSRIDTLEINEKKGPRDLVSEADIQVEAFLKEKLLGAFPGTGFWGEESGESEHNRSRWVVDPIDGTHSFLHGQYFWSISIALEIEGQIEMGAVYAPIFKDLYTAVRNQGAQKNGNPISVSKTANLYESMVCTGFACLRDGLADNNLERFCRIALKTRDQRRFGSAALDLCLVGCGRLDAFWEQHLNLYDVAAGALIVEEAGGVICDFKGNRQLDPEAILATNGKILEALLELM